MRPLTLEEEGWYIAASSDPILRSLKIMEFQLPFLLNHFNNELISDGFLTIRRDN